MDAPRDDLIRHVPFEITRSESDGDGLTLEGYAAVYDSPTEIDSVREGHFIERMKPGSFAKTLRERMPVLMFDHGKHPLIGSMPIGRIVEAREDSRGVFVRARLSDNWLVAPVRDAIAEGAIDGMSVRFGVPRGKEVWRNSPNGGLRERDILEVRCLELGPVVFPAYDATTVSVRSAELLAGLGENERSDEIGRALLRSMNGWTFGDARPVVADAIEDQLVGDACVCCIADLSDTFAVYSVWDPTDGESELFQVDYTIDASGAVTLGTPVEVIAKTTFIPATADEAADANEPGTSDAAGSGTPEPMRHSGQTAEERTRDLDLILIGVTP